MSASSSDNESSFRLFLTMNAAKIDRMAVDQYVRHVDRCRNCHFFFPCENREGFFQTLYPDDRDIGNHRSFWNVRNREKYILVSKLTSENRCWKCSGNTSNRSIECEFSEKKCGFCNVRIEFMLFSKNSKSNRKIVDGSFFSNIGGC